MKKENKEELPINWKDYSNEQIQASINSLFEDFILIQVAGLGLSIKIDNENEIGFYYEGALITRLNFSQYGITVKDVKRSLRFVKDALKYRKQA